MESDEASGASSKRRAPSRLATGEDYSEHVIGIHGLTRALSPVKALDIVRDEFQLGFSDQTYGRPLLAVTLQRGSALSALNKTAGILPCVMVGIAEGDDVEVPDGFDILLSSVPDLPSPWVWSGDVAASMESLGERVQSSPLASVALVQLLRLGKTLSLRDAIVAESFVYSMLQAGPKFHEWLRSRHTSPKKYPEPDPVLVSRQGEHLEIELNRPRVRNALNAAMRDALITALQIVLVDDSVRSARISGSGPAFCSGGDLNEFGLAQDPATAHSVRVARSVGALLSQCADRVDMDVHGACVGAGIEIAAFSNRITATSNAVFSLPEIGFGLIPGAGGTASLPRRIGRHRTAYMAITGTRISALTALEWGLVDEVRDRY